MKHTLSDPSLQSLGCVSSTLLIPLAARSQGVRWFPQFDPHDRYASAVLAALHTDVSRYLGDWATVLNVLWRTDRIKTAGQHFFAHAPQSTGVNLGSGLSNYFQWFDNGANHWIDADLAEVMNLRQCCANLVGPHCQDKAVNLTQAGWWKRLKLPTGPQAKPVFLICEGVLMYLSPQQVHDVLEEIGSNAPPGSELIFDFMSPVGIGRAAWHPSVGETGAEFTWGGNNAQQIAAAHPRFQVLSQRSVSEAYGLAGCMAEWMFAPLSSGPLYGLIHLGLTH